MSHSRHSPIGRQFGGAVLELLPRDGSAVPVARLAAALGLSPPVVGRICGQMRASVVKSTVEGVAAWARHPYLCEVPHGSR